MLSGVKRSNLFANGSRQRPRQSVSAGVYPSPLTPMVQLTPHTVQTLVAVSEGGFDDSFRLLCLETLVDLGLWCGTNSMCEASRWRCNQKGDGLREGKKA